MQNLKILEAIASTHPFELQTVRDVYKKTKSYDKTIRVLQDSLMYNLEISDMLEGYNGT
jgi:hypothetical protein